MNDKVLAIIAGCTVKEAIADGRLISNSEKIEEAEVFC